jgi:circadian clock protein KaiB
MTSRTTPSSKDETIPVVATEFAPANYFMCLYVTGLGSNSARAAANIRKICEEYLNGRYELEVVDLVHHPDVAAREQIVAAPTLVKLSPLPIRRFIGDMSRTDMLLVGLCLRRTPATPARGS